MVHRRPNANPSYDHRVATATALTATVGIHSMRGNADGPTRAKMGTAKHPAAEMARLKLTARNILEFPGPAKDDRASSAIYCDTEARGLRLEITKAGSRAFYLIFFFRGKKHCRRLGSVGTITLQEARAAVLEARAQLERGEFPVSVRDRNKATRTLREATRPYRREIRQRLRSYQDVKSVLKNHVLPVLGDHLITQLTPAMAQELHDRLLKATTPNIARKSISALSGLLTFCQRQGWVDRNVARLVRKARPNPSRERFLNDAELARFHDALDADKNQVAANLFRFLLATSWRRGEALGLMWKNVYTDRQTAFLERTKNGKSRHAPLSQEAVRILQSMPKRKGNAFVFPGRKDGQPLADPMPAFRRILKRARIDNLRPHDLRRTATTRALAAGVSLVELQELLDHSSPSVTRIYARLASGALQRAADIAGRASARSTAANHEGQIDEK